MYLSRVEIDVKNRRKIRDLTHLGAYHSWVENSFPKEIQEHERTRKLWRIDHLHGKSYLLIVSQEKPDFTCLEKYGVPGSAASKDYDAYLNQIQTDQTYLFRAVLNPVHAVMEKGRQRGRVYPLVTVDQQMKFLADRASKNGFRLNDYRITERKYEPLKKSGQRTVKLSQVAYEGVLTVTDPALLKKALTEGIGRKKAYGCGMITIIPEGR